MNAILDVSIIACAVLAGLSGGATFAFSSFVMQGLDRLPEPDAVRAMQAINVTALSPRFLAVFIGTGAFALALLALDAWLGATHGPWLLAGAALYVLGVVAVTVVGNVPLNERLADTHPDADGAWTGFARPWMRWNHLRTVAAAGASACCFVAVIV